jgi:hypothetical protein
VYVYTQLDILYTTCNTFILNHRTDKISDTLYITLRYRASKLRIDATFSWGCPIWGASAPNNTSHQRESQIFEAESRKEISESRIAI